MEQNRIIRLVKKCNKCRRKGKIVNIDKIFPGKLKINADLTCPNCGGSVEIYRKVSIKEFKEFLEKQMLKRKVKNNGKN